MKEEKFTITKFNRANGTFYYECTVDVEVEYVPKTLFQKIKKIFNPKKTEIIKYFVHETGSIYVNSTFKYNTMMDALSAIDNRVKWRNEYESFKVVSTETQVIIK